MLSAQRFARLNRQQQFKEMAQLAKAALAKIETLCEEPTAALSLQNETASLREYSQRLGGVAVIQRALAALAAQMPLINCRDVWLRLADSLAVEAGLELSEKEFTIRTTDLPKDKQIKHNLYMILDNIRSAFNVGGIFRTADAAGVSEMHLCGYTPQPGNAKLEKTALGSTATVSWSHWPTVIDAIEEFKRRGIRVLALETAEPSLDLFSADLPMPLALVAGNEQLGLSHEVLAACDGCLSIPMYGEKNSLNVACAVSAALYQIIGRAQ